MYILIISNLCIQIGFWLENVRFIYYLLWWCKYTESSMQKKQAPQWQGVRFYGNLGKVGFYSIIVLLISWMNKEKKIEMIQFLQLMALHP
jgi:hypothetical protein